MARNLIIQILGDADQFGRELDKAAGKTRKFGKAAGVAGLAIAGGLTVALSKSVVAAEDAQRVNAQTESTLKALGISYKSHGKEIDNVIQKTSKLAAIDDEELQGAFNDLVRSGGNVQKALKDTALAANISRGAHIGLAKAEKLILSAETGRVAGLQKYVGVLPKITTEQDKVKASLNAYKATHKHMTQAEKDRFAALLVTAKAEDKAATARNAIAVATKKYTGASEAYGKTAQGAQDRMRVSIENLEESIGKILLPTVEALASKMAVLADFFEKHTTLTKILVTGIGALATALIAVSVATKLANLAFLASPVGLIVLGIVALGVAIYELIKHWDDVTAAMGKVWDYIKGTFLGIWEDVKGALQGVKDWITNNWPEIATLLSGPFALILAPATNAFGIRDKLVAAFEFVKKEVKRIFDDVVTFFTDLPGNIWDGFQKGWEATKTNLGGAFNWVKDHVSGVVDAAANFFKALPGKIGDAIGGSMHFLKEKLEDLFSPKKIVEWIEHALGFSEHSEFFGKIGMKIVRSIATGALGAADLLKNAVGRLAKDVIKNAPGALTSGLNAVGGAIGIGKGGGDSGGGLDARVSTAVAFARSHGWHGTVTSGFRTYQEQAALYQRYLRGGPLAAKPGTSSHERGEAVDVTDYTTFGRIMQMLPSGLRLYNHLGAIDPVHYSVSGYKYGGVVPGMIGAPQLAVVHGGETITPPGQNGEYIIHNTVTLDGKVLYENWKKQAARDVKRNGGTGIRS